jgi:nitric oxide reductase NorD protein
VSGGAAVSASPDTNVALLHRLVRDREMLRRGFAQVWPRVAGENEALIEEFAGATLELSRVNAGPACIEAFWRAGLAAGPDRWCLVSAGGRAAANICRFAGAQAALACLEALPAAIRLTAANPIELGFVWQGLNRLSREAPTLVRPTARRLETLLTAGKGRALADFISAGLKATTNNPVNRAGFAGGCLV